MASIDELITAMGAAKERVDQVGTGIAIALSLADELRDEFASLGATDKTAAIESARRKLEDGQSVVAVIAERTEQLLLRAAALRAGTGTSVRGGSVPAPSTRSTPRRGDRRPRGVPPTWTDSPARNGKGRVWQRPGAEGNADMLRLMDPDEDYPYGYVRFYNEHNQPIRLDGKPGSQSETHIPVRKDGTYDVPQGWHDDTG
ncbi:hypothetical protein [Glycomyces tenuis]|uniref:hypothetical protein n=1 Tax=Glycomyces tenuis TaxID=58116 RepID=UPI0003F757F3|nr:hypothetical protein [Glycomyces tenuis]